MAIQERHIEAVAAINPDNDRTLEIQARDILKEVCEMMKRNPDDVEVNMEATVDFYAGVVSRQREVLPLLTPIRASAVYLENFVRSPLSKASNEHDDPTKSILKSLAQGVYVLSNALVEVDGALARGTATQVLMELSYEAQNMMPEDRAEYISRNRALRTYLTERRLLLFHNDRTGGNLLWQEYSDMIDFSEGRSPYVGLEIATRPYDPLNIEGASFVLNAYGVIYPAAKGIVGEGIVITS